MISNLCALLVATVSLALPAAAFATDVKVGEIEITNPYARAMLPGAKVGGGYLRITNEGLDDRLVSATTERAASVQLHEMKTDGGIMVMRELKDGIAIPENTTVDLKPGGYHLMFMNVAQPFKEGEMVKARLVFENAGSVQIEFQVGPAAGGALATKHDDHASAHASHGSNTEAASADPQQAIPTKLKAMFETADKALSVEPVVVQGDWAIAGWAQDGRGGRALLKKKADGWTIHLCSGDGLQQAHALRMMGLSETDANAIAEKLAAAEAHIEPEKLALFASFEGIVMVEGGDTAHGQHAGHDK